MNLERQQEASAHMNLLFALAGYRYTQMVLPAEEAFAGARRGANQVPPDAFNTILTRHCRRDMIFRANHLEAVRILRPNFDYILKWATETAAQFGHEPEPTHDYEYTAVPWSVTEATITKAEVRALESPPKSATMYWVLGGVCVAGLALLSS